MKANSLITITLVLLLAFSGVCCSTIENIVDNKIIIQTLEAPEVFNITSSGDSFTGVTVETTFSSYESSHICTINLIPGWELPNQPLMQTVLPNGVPECQS